MKYGFIHGGNSQVSFYIRVDGYPEIGFNGYSLKEALRKYRNDYDLRYKHIELIDARPKHTKICL